LHRFHNIVDRCLQVFVGLSLAVLVFLTFGQVVGRYIFGQSYGWVEEVSIVILCWSAWAAACLLLKDNRHLSVNLVIDRLPVKYRRLVRLFTGVVVFIFLMIIIYASKGTLEAMSGISFISFPLPINIKFFSVPVGAALLAYYLIRCLFSELREANSGDR
jgi:TRAP-type C4-dicarboxylate transport system permease small subunit